jgi:hypothetical protein
MKRSLMVGRARAATVRDVQFAAAVWDRRA